MAKKPMKSKRRKAVLLAGAGYGALKAAEDLSESGIPVVWMTKAKHFLEIPGGMDTFSEWPSDLNFQFRPLYLRVTRHPLVMPVTKARIESIKKDGEGFKAVVVQDPSYIDYDLCTGCDKCREVCPLDEAENRPLVHSPAYCPSTAMEMDKRKLAPCREACPLGVNVQAYMALTAKKDYGKAISVIRETNPLPGVCGRVCHSPCEDECRREDLEQPVAIRDIKRFLFDYEEKNGIAALDKPQTQRKNQKTAVIGSGPAGLTAAHYLNQNGYDVTIFESFSEAGGMLRAGINSFRLPRKVLDAEISAIENSGIEIKTGQKIKSVCALLKDGYGAVVLCTGTGEDLRLGLPGEDLPGVVHCVKFLSGVNMKNEGRVGKRTIVIGGGNSAMDAARTALRLGAEEVTVVAIEQENELPANPREVMEAIDEGVKFMFGCAPVEINGNEKFEKLVCKKAHWDFSGDGPPKIVYGPEEPVEIGADMVIVSISQETNLRECKLDEEIEVGKGCRAVVDDKCRTSIEGVFAAGDVVTGPSTVINSMAAGKKSRRSCYLLFDREAFPVLRVVRRFERGGRLC